MSLTGVAKVLEEVGTGVKLTEDADEICCMKFVDELLLKTELVEFPELKSDELSEVKTEFEVSDIGIKFVVGVDIKLLLLSQTGA